MYFGWAYLVGVLVIVGLVLVGLRLCGVGFGGFACGFAASFVVFGFDVCAMLIAFALVVGIWFWCWLLYLIVCGALAWRVCVCVLRFALCVFGVLCVLLFFG